MRGTVGGRGLLQPNQATGGTVLSELRSVEQEEC